MTYVNLTPHAINLNDGRVYPASGVSARVDVVYGDIVDDVCDQSYGDIQDLPDAVDGTRYIVSGVVLNAIPNGTRRDVVAPATGHTAVVRNDKGHIVSVPCFTRNKALVL